MPFYRSATIKGTLGLKCSISDCEKKSIYTFKYFELNKNDLSTLIFYAIAMMVSIFRSLKLLIALFKS